VSFDAAWLDLREPADRAARDPGLLAAAATHLRGAAAPLVLDLGCGTGATVRALGPLVPGARWRLVDQDETLLRLARERCGPCVEPLAADLRDLEGLPLRGVRMVTASALLDLMPGGWIERLAAWLAAGGVAFYGALSYDGQMQWIPAHADDAGVRAAFNRHQRRDKGLGPALGPLATSALARALRRHGFRVRTAPSAWRLGPEHAGLQAALIAGVARAAGEAGLDAAAWAQARRAAGASASCMVGHRDLLALPAAASAQSKTTSESSP
jgi:SAM-dependent methyltransferase